MELHESAKTNFDARAEEIASLIKIVPPPERNAPSTDDDIPVSASLTAEEIIGEIKETASDYKGKVVARFFTDKGVRFGLVDESHKKLVLLAEAIQRLPPVRDRLSQRFIEECIFDWAKAKLQNPTEAPSFCNQLMEQSAKVVKRYTVYVPIAQTVIRTPLEVFGITVLHFSKEIIDTIFPAEAIPEANKENAVAFIDNFRKEHQGRAAIRVQLECEPDHATDRAFEAAKKAADLLGLYSPAAFYPDIKSSARPKGIEHIDLFTVIALDEGRSFQMKTGLLDQASSGFWRIDDAVIASMKAQGIDKLSDIYQKKNPTGLEQAILQMAFLYSKAAFTADPMEKLVNVLAALESTLLKSESEPIQQNLAERMAILSARDLESRKAIIRNVKSVYGLRSRYLHHGHTTAELEQLLEFFFNVRILLQSLLLNAARFSTKEALLNAIDDQKLS